MCFLPREKVPFVSTLAQSKLVLRAAVQNDVKLLKELIEDRDHVARVSNRFFCGFTGLFKCLLQVLMHSHGRFDLAR